MPRPGAIDELPITACSTVETARATPARVPSSAGRGGARSRPAPRAPAFLIIELEQPNACLRVGDTVEFVVGYADTTVVLHDELYGIRDDRVEVVWPILGRGKLR